tara:strand:+ start:118 stop:1122 length:1005 start_codon:yes stop_codon:yes gene_type:complete
MNDIIDKIVEIVRKKNIKIITIAESNHRSYTSHTFQYELAKKLYQEKLINTFSSERMGVIDAAIINWYINKGTAKGTPPKNMIKKLPFGGMGYNRIIDFLATKPRDSYQIIGMEEDEYCEKALSKLPKDFDLLSEKFLSQIKRGVVIGKLKPLTKEDKKWYASLKSFRDYNREKFWLKELKKTLSKRGNIFINGYHLGKNDKIGKWLTKNYPSQVLCLGMAAMNITTQVLLINDKKRDFNSAVLNGNYKQKILNIDNICRPTKFERKHCTVDGWKLVSVTAKNNEERIRAIGCYLAMYEKDFKNGEKVYLGFKIKKYDYVIFFEKSEYKDKMFY